MSTEPTTPNTEASYWSSGSDLAAFQPERRDIKSRTREIIWSEYARREYRKQTEVV